MWEKLPEELTSSFSFSKVIGRGSFGVVVLAESKDESFWMDNCDVTGNRLRCNEGEELTKVAVKMMKPRKGEEPIAMREGLVLATVGSVADSPLIPRSTLTPP